MTAGFTSPKGWLIKSLFAALVAAWALSFTARAQSPPAEFYTNLISGGTTLNLYFKLHPNRTTNFTVYVQTGAGTFTNFTPDVSRTYLGYATNRSDVLACATLLPNGQIWARVVLGNSNSLSWYFQDGTTTASSIRGSPNFTAVWPTTPNLGAGGAGTNIYAARAGVDVRWSYLNACGGDLNTALRHVEQSVMAANIYYLQNAGLLHRLERVIIRSDQASDPYETTSSSLLTEEHNQWKYTLPAALGVGMPDVSVLPSPGYGGGVAYLSTAGTSSAQAVTDVRSLEFDIVWRHEVGHNWGSGDNQGGNAEGSTIMNGNSEGRFAGPELYKIVAYRNIRTNLFENLGRYAFRLPPHAALDLATTSVTTPATIDVLDNDHSAIGSPITIKSFDAASANGATITRSAGTGAGGRDQLIYTANPQGGLGMDRFAYQIQDTNGMTMTGNVFVQVTPPVSDLAGHWPLDENAGTSAHDLSGSGNNGTVQTNNAWTDGVFGGALNFDGATTQVALPALNLNTNTMTITAWIKRNGPQASMAGLVFSRAGNTVSGFNFGTANELRYTWNAASATYNWSSGLVVPDGQWTFVALVVDSAKGVVYMDDGSGLKSATNVVANANEDFSGTTYLGQDSIGGRLYRGVMDDVHIFRRSLNAAEIAEFAAGGGTAFNPTPAQGATLAAASAMLGWQNPRYAQSQQLFIGTNYFSVRNATTSSPEYAGAFAGSQFSAVPASVGTYYWRVDEVYNGQPVAGPVWFFSFTPTVPAAQWRLNELSGAIAYDTAGTNLGTYFNAPTLNQPGVLIEPTNRAVKFNGSNQKVDVPCAPVFSATPLTIEVWCKATNLAAAYRSPATCRDDVPPRGWAFYAGSDTNWQFWSGTGTTNSWTQLVGPAVVINQWVQLVAVLDGNSERFYVNGALVDSADGVYAPNTVRPLRIGAGATEGAGSQWFPGLVDEVTLYNSVWSDADVAAHYNAQTNEAPAFVFDPFTKSSAAPGVTYADSLAADATDPNAGDTLTFSKMAGPAWLTVAADGTLSGTPGTNDSGLNSFSVRVTDFGGLTNTGTMLIPIGAAVWNGAGENSQWTNTANWNGPAPTNSQALIFQGIARRVNTNNALATAGQIGLNNAGFSIGGNPLNLAGGIVSYGLNTWNVPGTLTTPQTFWSSVGMLLFGGALNLNGQALTVDGTDDILFAGALSGSGSILKQGTGNLIVSGTNSLTATVRVNSGMLQIGNGGGSGDIGTAAVTNNGAVKFFRTNSFPFANVISGSGSVVQSGAGTVTVTGSNTYSGTTTISAGTLALSGGDNRLPTNTTVIFSANATFNVGTNSQTLSAVDLYDNVTAVVTGAGGTLMANGAADFRIGGVISSAAQTVDMSGLANFIFNQSGKAFDAGGQTANNVGASSGTVTLATNNIITASAFGVADAGAYPANANTGTVNLGRSNVLNAGTITIGGGGGWAGTGTVKFRSGTPNPSLTLRNTAGTGRATVTVGYAATSDYSSASGTVDLTNGVSGTSTLDAQAGTMTIGKHAYANVNYDRAASGNFVMGGGTLDVTTLVIGQKNYSGGRTGSSATGTFSVNGGMVIANTLTLGDQVGNNGPSVSGTFNLNGGGTLRAQTIQPGAGTASRPFNWNSGTIRNYDSATNLTITSGLTLATAAGGTHDFNIDAARSGTINAIIAGGGAITKSGAGSVTLTATNTYTGPTTINAGTFALGSAGSLSASPIITVAGGALFDIASASGFTIGAAQKLQGFGSVRGSPTIAGTLAPGSAIGTLTFSNNLTLAGTTLMEIARTNGAATNDQAVVAGTVTYGGSLVVTNLGMEPLQWGDTFKLFSAGVRNGSFSSTNLPPLTLPLYWTNRLAADGTIAVATTVNTLPTNVVVGASGTNLTLSWPADYTGWRLLVQTNPPGTGLGTNWFTWPNSTNVHSVSVSVTPTNASVFFKLVYP